MATQSVHQNGGSRLWRKARLAFTLTLSAIGLSPARAIGARPTTQNVAPPRAEGPFPASWRVVDVDSTWCGAKGLWLVARGFAMEPTFDEVRDLCMRSGGSSDGVLSMATLAEASGHLGLSTRGVHCRLGWLRRAGLPALTLHRGQSAAVQTDDPGMTHHFLEALPNPDAALRVVDPFQPVKVYEVSDDEFCQSWTGDALLVARRDDELPRPTSRGFAAALIVIVAVLAGWICRRGGAARRRLALTVHIVPLCFICPWLLGCGPRSPEAPLQFEHTRFDAVELADPAGRGPKLVHAFQFVNAGNESVHVAAGKPGCACAVVRCPDIDIPPGGSGEVELSVDLGGRVGNFETYAPVSASAAGARGGASVVVLRVAAFVVPGAWARPTSFEFGDVTAGDRASQRVEVAVPLKPSEKFAGVTITQKNEDVRYRLAEAVIEELAPAGVMVARVSIDAEIQPAGAGRTFEDELAIEVPNRQRTLRVPLRGRATHRAFNVEPPIVNFGSIGPDG
ncbi:MAG TPA: DUF1573 domain-containing protein, partial [Pirellulales bacterium]|nr:DUF1573 domain-containing protein [Pirellulales bacterium]